jgi:hypothetical protein
MGGPNSRALSPSSILRAEAEFSLTLAPMNPLWITVWLRRANLLLPDPRQASIRLPLSLVDMLCRIKRRVQVT